MVCKHFSNLCKEETKEGCDKCSAKEGKSNQSKNQAAPTTVFKKMEVLKYR